MRGDRSVKLYDSCSNEYLIYNVPSSTRRMHILPTMRLHWNPPPPTPFVQTNNTRFLSSQKGHEFTELALPNCRITRDLWENKEEVRQPKQRIAFQWQQEDEALNAFQKEKGSAWYTRETPG